MIEVTVEINSSPGGHGKVIGKLLIGRQVLEEAEVANYRFELWKGERSDDVPLSVVFGDKSQPTHPRLVAGEVLGHRRGNGVWALIHACLDVCGEEIKNLP